MALENHVQIECKTCGLNYCGYVYKELDSDQKTCEDCGNDHVITPYDQITDPDIILSAIESELEGANHHSSTDLPRNLYSAIEAYVPPEARLTVVRLIAKEIYDSI